MRFNPKAINRQYTMPHSPGNTEASFLRTAFSHLAHGSKMLDYFGIGMNECFTENHIDHRDKDRYRQIRDVNHSLGLVEDVWLQSQGVQSETAILLSESTERWDLAPIAGDQVRHEVFGPEFRKARLSYHLERVGLWKALTFAGVSPDLLIEEDLQANQLKGYRMLFVVGDSLPLEAVPILEKFIKDGGTVVATAGVGRYGTYREPNPALQALFGIEKRTLVERERFIRPLQEMQFLKPLGTIDGKGWEMPALAIHERIKPAKDVEVLATHKDDGSPAIIRRNIGKGRGIYISALPGIAYMWTACQPPLVPARGPETHQVPVKFDPGVTTWIGNLIAEAKIEPPIRTEGNLIDTRLIRSGKTYILPVANFNREVGQDVRFSIHLDGKVDRITSAYKGPLTASTSTNAGRVLFTLPKLGYGDMIRIDLK